MTESTTASKTSGGITPSWFETGSDTHKTGQDGPAGTPTTPPPGPNADPVDGSLIGRTSIGLIAVIGVILICAWLLKRLGFQRDRASDRLKVVASRNLGQRERVVIVEVEDEWLVLGVTSQNVNALHRRPAPADRDPDPEQQRHSTTRPSFGQALAENIGRLGRRDNR